MSRLNYAEYDELTEEQASARWHNALRSAIRGQRGQRLLRDLIAGLNALPEPELAAGALEDEATGCVCALGAVRRYRGPENVQLGYHPSEEDLTPGHFTEPFDIAYSLAWEVVAVNEEWSSANDSGTRRLRWQLVMDWAVKHLQPPQGEEVTE